LLPADGLEAEFQRIKTGIHRELLDPLDLSRITGLRTTSCGRISASSPRACSAIGRGSCRRSTKSG
jgi:hypothetical protein